MCCHLGNGLDSNSQLIFLSGIITVIVSRLCDFVEICSFLLYNHLIIWRCCFLHELEKCYNFILFVVVLNLPIFLRNGYTMR